MDATRFLVVTQLRRHRLRIVALAVLVAVVGGVVIASVLGAERSRSSLSRFITQTEAADVGVFGASEAELSALAAHPDVAHLSSFRLPALVPTSVLDRSDVFLPMAAHRDGAVPYEFNGYRILQGRMPEPDVATEIALHEATAELLEVGVGGHVEMAMFTEEQLETVFALDQAPESLETVDFEVVGVMRDPLDVIARPTDIAITPLTPAAAERFEDLGSLGDGALVDLRPGADVDAFSTELAAAVPEGEIERWIGGMDLASTGIGSTLDVIGGGLLAVAIVVAGAGVLAVGQTFARAASASRVDDAALDALGLDRRRRRLVALAPGTVIAVLGGVGSGLVALGLSPRFPIGVARRAEPDPGFDAHPGVVLGAVVVTVVAATLAVIGVAVGDRRGRSRATAGPAMLRTPDPVARVIGSGSAALARSTQLAVAFGACAVAAALVFGSSLTQLQDSPRQYGWSFDSAVVSETNDPTTVIEGVDVAADPAVAEVGEALFQIQLTIDDQPSLGYAIGDGSGSIQPVVARGRPPATADEVALGRETLRQLDAAIGDEVSIDGGAGPATFRVVGQAIIPVSADGGRIGNGAVFVTQALPSFGIDRPDACEQSSCYRQVVVRWEEGADLDAAADRLLAEKSGGFVRPVPPPEVERLSEVDAMPWVVAGLLAVLAGVAAVHAVVVTVQRRRRDLGVLRALGATPAQSRRGIRLHVAALVAVWGVVGAVLGVVVGRAVWQAVTGSLGVGNVADVPVLAVGALPFVVLLLTQVAAALPARRAARLRPTQVLRSE